MKRLCCRFLAICLCFILCLPAALAAGDQAFPKIKSYSGFPDMTGHWAEPYVRVCVETGLMEGVGGRFAPEATLTNGETAALAARIREALTGEAVPSGSDKTLPWYQRYVDYLADRGVSVEAPAAYATREGFFRLLSAVLPDDQLTPINSIMALPDASDPDILKFYNAGILTGIDLYGTFAGASPLSRAQCATMIARIADPALRKFFSPAGQTPASPFPADAVVMTVDGAPVTFDQFQDTLLSLIQEVQDVYRNYDLVFDWEGSFGLENWPVYFKEAAKHSLAAQALSTAKAAQLGCPPEELALALFGPPTEAELAAMAADRELDRQQPGRDELLSELILEEKLNKEIGQWIENADISTTEIFDQIDSQELWETFG